MKRFVLSKLLLISILLVFSLGLGACSNQDEDVDVDKPEISVDESTKGSDLVVPDEYPDEIIPIYPNSHLYSVVAFEDSYTLMLYSKDEVSVVINYYKDVFKNATNKMETLTSDAYTVFGELDGYTVTFDCGEDDELEGYQTLIVLNVIESPE